MKCLVFVFAIMAVALFTSPARADYALVRFEGGWCRIWWDSAGTPWGAGWTKVAMIGWWPRLRSVMRACKACVGN